jgi:hypothetical protein
MRRSGCSLVGSRRLSLWRESGIPFSFVTKNRFPLIVPHADMLLSDYARQREPPGDMIPSFKVHRVKSQSSRLYPIRDFLFLSLHTALSDKIPGRV